jgi:hypothetical protein
MYGEAPCAVHTFSAIIAQPGQRAKHFSAQIALGHSARSTPVFSERRAQRAK